MDADIHAMYEPGEACDELRTTPAVAAVRQDMSDVIIDHTPCDGAVEHCSQQSDGNKSLSEEHVDKEDFLCSSNAAYSNTVTSLTCDGATDAMDTTEATVVMTDARCEAKSQAPAVCSERSTAAEHSQSVVECASTDSCTSANKLDDAPHEMQTTTTNYDDWLYVLGHDQLKMRACICISAFISSP